MAELRRASIRIVSNYVRLVSTAVLGIYLVRALLTTLGDEGAGLVSLLGSTIGIVAIVEEAASWSMIRELGAAHHSKDVSEFRRLFNSAIVLSAAAAVLILVAFGVILAALPLMKISPEMLPAARWFVIAKAIETAFLVLFSPQFNMYLVTERMVAYNFWYTMRRAIAVAGIVALFWINADSDPARGLILYGWISCGLMIISIATSSAIITLQDRRMIPSLAFASKAGVKSLIGISGWTMGIQGSQTLGFPAGALIMNQGFGVVFGNLAYGTAYQLSGYARMLASGMTMGLDAVAARISSDTKDNRMPKLVRYSTMLHGIAIFPAVIAIGFLAYPMLEIWVGPKLNANPQEMLHNMSVLTRIFLISMGIVCLCDGWTRIMFGAGHVKSYAPAIILGNLITPVVAIIFLMIFPADVRYTAVVCAIAVTYIVVHMGVIPHKTAAAFGMTYWEVLQPLVRPLLTALGCAPVLWLFLQNLHHWNLISLAMAGGTYGVVYMIAAWFFVLHGSDRTRLAAAARFRLADRFS